MARPETAWDIGLLTLEEAHQALHIGRTTLWRLIRRGDIAVVRIVGRTFVERSEILRLVDARRERAGTVESP